MIRTANIMTGEGGDKGEGAGLGVWGEEWGGGALQAQMGTFVF